MAASAPLVTWLLVVLLAAGGNSIEIPRIKFQELEIPDIQLPEVEIPITLDDNNENQRNGLENIDDLLSQDTWPGISELQMQDLERDFANLAKVSHLVDDPQQKEEQRSAKEKQRRRHFTESLKLSTDGRKYADTAETKRNDENKSNAGHSHRHETSESTTEGVTSSSAIKSSTYHLAMTDIVTESTVAPTKRRYVPSKSGNTNYRRKIIQMCKLPKRIGNCFKILPRYYFDAVAGECKYFQWTGCHGNLNRFSTRKQCEKKCLYRM